MSQPGSAGAASEDGRPDVASYVALAIGSMFLCCFPAGLVALAYAVQVGPKLARGDTDGARTASERVIRWLWVGVGWAIVVYLSLLVLAAAT